MSDGLDLVKSQPLTLMHELAHMYLYWTIGSRMDVYHVEQCLALPARNTVANVENYVYYTASKLYLLLWASEGDRSGQWEEADGH